MTEFNKIDVNKQFAVVVLEQAMDSMYRKLGTLQAGDLEFSPVQLGTIHVLQQRIFNGTFRIVDPVQIGNGLVFDLGMWLHRLLTKIDTIESPFSISVDENLNQLAIVSLDSQLRGRAKGSVDEYVVSVTGNSSRIQGTVVVPAD